MAEIPERAFSDASKLARKIGSKCMLDDGYFDTTRCAAYIEPTLIERDTKLHTAEARIRELERPYVFEDGTEPTPQQLGAAYDKARERIRELEQERDGTNWFPESFVIQLQEQLREVTERCDHFCKMALVPDGTESRKEIAILQAQLQALTQERNEQFKAAAALARVVTSMDERLQALIQERDQLITKNAMLEDELLAARCKP
jgi:DNA repair exonuclease SbcCD ATPase subunit